MSYIQCEALTRKGEPCLNGAMAHSRYCGPHIDYDPHKGPKKPRPCQALTRKHRNCPNAAEPNSDYCHVHINPLSKFQQINNRADQLDLEL